MDSPIAGLPPLLLICTGGSPRAPAPSKESECEQRGKAKVDGLAFALCSSSSLARRRRWLQRVRARSSSELAGARNASERMGTMDATMGLESSERVPVFAEAQVQPRSAANLTDLRK